MLTYASVSEDAQLDGRSMLFAQRADHRGIKTMTSHASGDHIDICWPVHEDDRLAELKDRWKHRYESGDLVAQVALQ